MAITSKQLVCLVAFLGCLVVQQALGDNKNQGDELQLGLDNPSQPTARPAPDETIIISDPDKKGDQSNQLSNNKENPNNNNIDNNPNYNQQLPPNNFNLDENDDGDDDDDNEDNQDYNIQPRPPFVPFGIQNPFKMIWENPRRFIDQHLRRFRYHAQDMDRRFSELERQAGEGEHVSYFRRNNVAYVQICTTRKIGPDESIPDNQVVKDLDQRPSRR